MQPTMCVAVAVNNENVGEMDMRQAQESDNLATKEDFLRDPMIS